MRKIQSTLIQNTIKEMFLKICISPAVDVTSLLETALQKEQSDTGKNILSQLIKNNSVAKKTDTPACQDTGMAVVFLDIGRDVYIEGNITDAVNEGVRQAYSTGYFRKSVTKPISRINTGDNTPALIHFDITEGENIKIRVMAKGFGSENMSRIKMLKPSDGKQGIIDFLVETAESARANPCPPVFLGVGIGGSFDMAATLSKKALFEDILSDNTDPVLAEIETTARDRINALGLGPMGLGGNCYCLKINALSCPTHIAGLPVAVNYCCHALRRAETVL